MRFIKSFMLLCLFSFTQACTQVDNYVLGKENTPKPKELEQITSKVQMNNKWTAHVEKKSKSQAYLKLKPVIINNKMYLANANGVVQAIDKLSGEVIWTTNLGNNIVSGPVVSNNSVVVGTDAATIILLDNIAGKTKWTAHLSEDSLSKSVILNDKVIVKTIDGNLYAFDVKTGKKLWVYDHGSPSLILKASSSPVVVGKYVVVGFSDGKLDAVDADDGRLVWQKSIAYATGASDVERLIDIDADPIVHDNVVYVASYQGYISGLSLETGQFLWNKAGSVYKNMALGDGKLYVVDSRDTLWAFDNISGRVIWKQTALNHHGLTDPVLMGDKIVVGDKTGFLHIISTKDGNLIGRKKLGSAINISPVVSKDIAYTLLKNGNLTATQVS
ncbi:MAG: outer membrane protein assembly factor BamB [Legionellales bacterium RIFCSPHIGHO2_12_FULL_35_11]|nr:MAG: outer membrane protein assembly factor BamB [Legionellales bacterium RIFCSPHIGHO2_12_FULL_35_11]